MPGLSAGMLPRAHGARYGIESGWKILGERSVAVPLAPLNKREVLKTPYIQIWCRCGYISAPTDRGIDVFSSISVKCLHQLHIYIYIYIIIPIFPLIYVFAFIAI